MMRRALFLVTALLLLGAQPAFAFRNFSIAADSMLPTLGVGDVVTAALYGVDYQGLSRGEPFAPSNDPTVQPRLGDIAFFSVDDTVFVMRIVGMPGDRVEMRDGVLQLNGEPVPTEPVQPVEGACRPSDTCRFLRETLPGARSHLVISTTMEGYGDNTKVFVVPDEAYFVMGDNRDISNDSRYGGGGHRMVGFVPRVAMIGRLHAILASERPGDTAERLEGFSDRR